MTANQSMRQKRQEQKRKQDMRSKAIWGIVIVFVLVIVGVLVRNATRPPEGREFAIMDADHISENEPLPEYNSNPPTSGPHYSQGLPRGFFDEEDLTEISGEPVGHAIHNLEHGYIILWYNCDILSENDCSTLKEELQDYLSKSLVPKQIAFPWSGTDFPVVLTSWGRMLEMDEFDRGLASNFVNANRLLAPEPNAP